MPDSISTEADLLRCGFDIGYFDKSDIARWADRWILAIDEPCLQLFDLSFNRSLDPYDVSKLLRSLGPSESSTTAQTTFGFLGLLYEDRRISAQDAIGQLFWLVHEPELTDDERSRIYHLDHDCDYAEHEGYGTMSEIEDHLSDFLCPYGEQLSAKHPDLIARKS
ncbi:hypothetical protein [Bremerella sp.]|uniref:hypothetical protein n=1 Tax=Bremerella sp. TaxID=2795602 RepID=UPI0039196A14